MRAGLARWSGALWLGVAGCVSAPTTEPPASTPEPLLSGIRQLTFAGRRSGEGYFDAAGRRLVFQSEREPGNPFYQIYLLDLGDGSLERVSTGVGKTTCAWFHPDGRRVLFASTHHASDARAEQQAELEARAAGGERRYAWDFDPDYELWERDLASGALRRLTRARGYDAEGAWSPDGRFVVFASNRHAYAGDLAAETRERFEADPSVEMDLYRLEASTGQVTRLTDTPGYDGGPFASADGQRIVWRRFAPDGASAEIYTMPAQGGPERRLTHLNALSWAPFFHPSGDYVVFATNLHGHANFELYLVDAEGVSRPVRVTETDGFDGLPAFSPDGRRLVWTSTRGPEGASQLFVADWDDASARRRLGLPPAALPPASPEPEAARFDAREIDPADLRRHVARLTAPEMAGRATGSPGERRATAYVAGVFDALGLTPAGEAGGWFERFEFTAGVSLAPGNRLVLATPASPAHELPVEQAWRPLGFSRTGDAPPGRVVFAGYGIVAPENEPAGAYDSYGDLDVRDAWVLMLRHAPQQVSEAARRHWGRYASLRHKAMLARDRGARGILVASGRVGEPDEQLIPLHLDGSAAASSLFALSISNAVAEALLAPAQRSWTDLEAALDRGEPVAGFALPDVTVEARVALVQERRSGRNVLARLRSRNGAAEPALVVGAHVDHLGRGGASSLARGDERGQVHPGADDNASGVAALLEIAAELVARQRRGAFVPAHDVIFAAWSGEELGLLGAEHFVRGRAGGHAGDASGRIGAYLNLDMVGRLRERLVVQGVGSSDGWPALLERVAAPGGLSLRPQHETYLPTDATAFYLRRVPFLSFFTGAHAEYHTPRDTAQTLDFAGLERVAELVARLAIELAVRPDPPGYREQAPPRGAAARTGLRARLGSIPDYVSTEERGVRLSGVVAGGPADRAGVRAGDRVVGLAGRPVENIYDYTYVIEGLAVGEEVEIVVIRDGERRSLRITPESRE